MKKLLLLTLLFFVFVAGCKKDSNDTSTNVEVKYAITSSSAAEKVVDSDKPRFNFSGKTYNGTYTLQKGTTMRFSCGYSSFLTGETIRVVLTKNGVVIFDQTKEQRVDYQMIP